MELYFTDNLEIEFGDNCEFELSEYMVRLSPENIIQDFKNRNLLIIASGMDPVDHKITLITAIGKVMIFDSKKFHIPYGPVVPCNHGQQVFLENINNRWPGNSLGFYVESTWMLEKSVSGLTNTSLEIR